MQISRHYLSFLIGLSVLLSTGCETTLDFQLNGVPKLTIISHMNPAGDVSQRVFVYATQSPSDSSNFYTPDNLVVDVTEIQTNNTARLVETIDNGKIYFEFPEGFLHAGHNYSITAFAPGFTIVQASTYIPNPSKINNLSIRNVIIEQSDVHDNKKNLSYDIVFDIDHVDQNSYYHLIFKNEYKNNAIRIIVPEPSDDQPFIQHYEYGVLIDKDNLDDPGSSLSFSFKDFVLDDNSLIRVQVELRTINEEYYRYHSTLTRQLIIRQDPFAEPVTIYNNIEGGFGNFSGFSPFISSSDLPQ